MDRSYDFLFPFLVKTKEFFFENPNTIEKNALHGLNVEKSLDLP